MKPLSRRVALTSLAAFVWTVACPAFAKENYTLVDLGAVTGRPNVWVWEQTLNERGQVAFYANSTGTSDLADDVAGVWLKGKVVPLSGLPGASVNRPQCINDRGQVVGVSGTGPTAYQAVRWDFPASRSRAVATPLGILPGDTVSWAFRINNQGQAVGFSSVESDFNNLVHCRAVLWQNGAAQVLPALPDATFSLANDITESGVIVGHSGATTFVSQPTVWRDGAVSALPTLGGDFGAAIALNESERIVGISSTAAGDLRACLWQEGVATDLGTFGDDPFSLAVDINNRGQIVGFSSFDFIGGHALLWEEGQMIDLQTRIPADSGWTLLAALAINDRGQIAGYGLLNGQIRSFLMTPAGK